MASETHHYPTAIQTGTKSSSLGNGISASSTTKSSDFPQVIPPVALQKGRNLILCFDGTGDQYDQSNSNIVRFMQLLKKDDRSKQMVYYQAGIGTGVGNAISAKVEELIDAAVATRLPVHVRGGYEFLMQNYTEGDRISLFGFSRGAYTARALAGMLHKVGLLPAYNHEQIPFAYAMFNRDDEKGWEMSNGFKRAFSIDVKIDFLGVFDTVNSVGIIPHELPFARTNYLVRVFRHAVSLDEHRAKFKANLWGDATEKEEKLGEGGKHKVYHHAKAHKGSEIWDSIAGVEEPEYEEYRNGRDHLSPAERGHEFPTDVKEVWFAGAHCDVGGGSVSNDTPNSLARIPLRWMIRECFRKNTGILFHSAELHEIGINPASLWPTPPPEQSPLDVGSPGNHSAGSTGSTAANGPTEEGIPVSDQPPKLLVPTTHVKLGCEHDMKDATMPIYDQLSLVWWWWILELIPLRQKYQPDDKSWFSWFSINFGKPRKIHGKKTYVHHSVRYRIQHPDSKYTPRAEFSKHSEVVWVD